MRYFSEDEINKFSRKYRRNKVKQDTYRTYINDLNEKKIGFEEIWTRGMKITRQVYGFMKKDDRDYLNKPFSDLVSSLIREYVLYPDSIIENFNKMEGHSPKDRFFNATSKVYEIRTSKFMNKYGSREFKFNGEKHSLNEWMQIYKSRGISREEMNEIIKQFKAHDDEFLSQTYKGRNYEQKSSL